MTREEINKGLRFFEEKVNQMGTHPGQILMKADGFIESLSKFASWSHKNAQFFTNLLLCNQFLELKGAFIYLTAKGYSVLSEKKPNTLLIDLRSLILFPGNPLSKTFYLLWDIIGNHKEDNPFYVDGKIFYDTVKLFIDGLPPSYSKFTSSLQQEGKSTSRIDWGLDLFKLIPQNETSVFLDSLSERVNLRIKAEEEERQEMEEFDRLIENIENNFEPINDFYVEANNRPPKIFISHNSKDADYAKALVNLLVSLGVNEEKDVFCSSLPGCGVKFGKNFIETIRDQYDKHDLIMLFIHSPRYYESHISLCEMGAAWIMRKEHRSFLTNDCKFEMLDALILPAETAFRAGQENTYHLLNDFKELIEKRFNLQPKSMNRWETIKNDFISAVIKQIDLVPNAPKDPNTNK